MVMLAALIFTHSYISLSAILAAAVHEIGHLIAARMCGIPLRELRLGIFGAVITPTDAICSYKKELALAAAGPFINLLSAAILFPLRDSLNAPASFFLASSLFLGILNLLPVQDFDGGRILNCILAQHLAPKMCYSVCRTLSLLTVISLWMLSVYLLLRRSSSLSLFVFSLSLFCKIFVSQKN